MCGGVGRRTETFRGGGEWLVRGRAASWRVAGEEDIIEHLFRPYTGRDDFPSCIHEPNGDEAAEHHRRVSG